MHFKDADTNKELFKFYKSIFFAKENGKNKFIMLSNLMTEGNKEINRNGFLPHFYYNIKNLMTNDEELAKT